MFGKPTCQEPIENDRTIQAVSKIFNVMVRGKQIPPCFLTWIAKNFHSNVWQLRVIPFQPIDCKYFVEGDGMLGIRYYECGCNVNERGYSIWGFKNRQIGRGAHENLNKVIHCLGRLGISYANMEIEEWFDGSRVDILARTNQGKKILVELGEISDIGKYFFPDMKEVKEFWFGDNGKFIYSISKQELITPENGSKEERKYSKFIAEYYKTYCNSDRLYYHCISSDSAYNCSSILRLLEIE